MGLFSSNSTNKDTSNSAVDWIDLTDIQQWKDIIDLSDDSFVAIFKHSTRCGISRMALKQFESEFEASDNLRLYYLDLLNHRDISNAIAQDLDVWHESPQLILIHKKIPIMYRSHGDISAIELLEKVKVNS